MDLIRAKNKEIVYTFPFCFLLAEFVVGMYLNDIFLSYLTFADEALAVILLGWTIKYAVAQKKEPFNRETKIFAGIALFYLLYSFYIRSNVPVAILGDLIIQLKPFIAFFMMGYIGFVLNDSQKTILRKVCLLLFFITAIIGIISLISGYYVLFFVFGHPMGYGTTIVLIGLTFLFCSDLRNKKDLIWFIVIISFSPISLKAKTFGFYGVTLFLILALRGNLEIKFSIKNVIIACCLIAIASYLAWDKLAFYYINYTPENEETLVRPLMFLTAWEILFDYFPFGSGLASFATHYSGVFYSHIYADYNMDTVWGLIEGDTTDVFITDTQYPSIAQYGMVGLVLFTVFWTRIIIRANRLKKETGDITNFLIVILILLFLAIESFGDAVFTSPRGFYVMLLMSLTINKMKGDVDVQSKNDKES
jgi:hypothetical protein